MAVGVKFWKVRNHDKFQSYSRRPQWIKLHRNFLTDYAFCSLTDTSKYHALALALLAADTNNHIPNDPKWVGQLISARSRVNFGPLEKIGFLVPCDCGQCSSLGPPPPRVKQPASKGSNGMDSVPLPPELGTDDFEQAWREWLHYRRTELRKPVRETTAKRQLKALARVGPARAVETLQVSMRNGWTGIFPDKGHGGNAGKTDFERDMEAHGYADPRYYDADGKYTGRTRQPGVGEDG